MYYPANFPKEIEKKLIDLLLLLEKDFQKKIPSDEKKFHRLILDKWKLSRKPSNWWLTFILLRFEKQFSRKFTSSILPFLVKTKTRSLSGIVPLTLFTKGTGCPFNCVYCPNEPGIPKSYFSDEPAVMRAIRHGFDPFKQTLQRLVMFTLSGHPIDKVEIIIKGGTFSFYPKKYRTWFAKRIFDACNIDVEKYIKTSTLLRQSSATLSAAQIKNESAQSRIIGINIETRPDYINQKEIVFLRTLGVTHVEIGVQILDNEIYKLIRRGHTVEDVINATRLLKDAGFKVGYHLMPNLPGSSPKKDLETLSKVFTDKHFKPDHLKLYPTTITKHTLLNGWVKKGLYKPYQTKKLIRTIIRFKSEIAPSWVRIGRLTRDITTTVMEGNKIAPNLREYIQSDMKNQKLSCKCIRCREIKDKKIILPIKLEVIKYESGGGQEYFLQYVDTNNLILGFLRLRIPFEPFLDVLKNTSIVRELHVYGAVVKIGEKSKEKTQHMSFGSKLLYEAEKITKDNGVKKIAVIAGVGVRPYYRKFGYKLEKTYMLKVI